jgi:hypothetical protein
MFGDASTPKSSADQSDGAGIVAGSNARRLGSSASAARGRSYLGASSVKRSTGRSQTTIGSPRVGSGRVGS